MAEKSGEIVRVRFAPSPTGYLHIGGARTALFNYLFARQHGGVFVLRIEDTDRARSTPEAIQAIFDGLEYLGLDFDEGPGKDGGYGPYFQSERAGTYAPLVERLLAAGKVYPCFCTRERLDALRESQRAAKERILYDRACLELDRAVVADRVAAGDPYVLRFHVPEGETVVDDMIRGRVVTHNSEIEDFIVCRSDGSVVYNFAVVGDDHGMRITHVIRGEDHLSNTAKQILLFEALDLELPRFAHIPLILAPGGGKLSKRHGAVSVTEYAQLGYLPAAMNNFLARMGWSFDDKQEIFSMGELVEKFSLRGVSKSGAMYDLKKLQHLGGHHLREASTDDVVAQALSFLTSAGLLSPQDVERDRDRLRAMIELEQPRMEHLSQIVDKVSYYFAPQVTLETGGRKVLRKKKDSADLVARYADALESDVPAVEWKLGSAERLEAHAREFIEAEGVGLGDLAQPVRALLTGRSATPSLFDVMLILGPAACLERLRRGPELFREAGESS